MKDKTKKQRKFDTQTARYHVMHGLFPGWEYYDHRTAIGRKTNYWEHLLMNMKCARRHWRLAHGK